jgi:hypothetical protein
MQTDIAMDRYDFDKVVDRKGSGAIKTDALKDKFGRADLIPLWVADMDFETPGFIVEALKERMVHPVFGYTAQPADYWPTVQKWIRDHHGWETQCSWMTFIPGIVKGLGYSMTPFILAENPDMTAREAISASSKLMNGHKWELFVLGLTFIGWELLCVLSLGIGFLWLNPYMNATYAAFYRQILADRKQAIED